MNGQGNKVISIIGTYQVCHGNVKTAGPTTALTQQYSVVVPGTKATYKHCGGSNLQILVTLCSILGTFLCTLLFFAQICVLVSRYPFLRTSIFIKCVYMYLLGGFLNGGIVTLSSCFTATFVEAILLQLLTAISK
jgi:hypothetical protein